MKRTVAVLASVVSPVALLIFGYRLVASDSAGEQRVQTASARPNIVFVMTDDMPKGLWKSMPTLRSRVSAEGARFTDAYVTQSLCCPSRATVLTGEYPHNHGITGNHAPNGGEAEFRSTGQDRDTIATRMQAEGYRTALVGKYMNGYKGEYVPPGWSYWYTESGGNGVNDNGRMTANRPESFPVTIANRARAFLDGATDEAEDPPFMLFYWTTQPHLPAKAPPGYRNRFRSVELPRPPSFDEADVSDKPAYIKNLPGLTREKVDRLETNHVIQLRTMSQVDDTLKDMLDLLEDRGELANTYVVFATDNGVHMGQHRYVIPRGSKSTPYEEAASTPLMIRGPGVPQGEVRTQLVANNDLAPTFAT
jgi:N-acetylglucosamine-6-sulfatase